MSGIDEIRHALFLRLDETDLWRALEFEPEGSVMPPVALLSLDSGSPETFSNGIWRLEYRLQLASSNSTARTGLATLDDMIWKVYELLPQGYKLLDDAAVFCGGFNASEDIQAGADTLFGASVPISVSTHRGTS
jgi:hypothetical protein